ncbi:trigger factor-like isoform X1 [Phoenix dactylifera]|uniref:peptidylprolyl isomerase n=1 Tax=Phoenix dactylifera TaxID=42345 RepID=A0A8B7BYT3_PHODC|nr:trigger factor-like isoform X1 [Phoenix dactylifera]
MALMAMTTIGPRVPFQRIRAPFPRVMVSMHAKTSVSFNKTVDSVAIGNAWEGPYQSLMFSCGRDFTCLSWPTFATGSGLEASITDQKKSDLSLDNVKIVVESRDDDKIHVRVDLTGEETQKALDDVLTNLARTAPPIPGFRKMKGGKTSNVPKSFLLQVLGRDRVTKFLIEEIVGMTIGDYVKKEKLKVKSQFKTTQTAVELESAFTPGSEFGFNATIDFDKSDLEATSSGSS